MKLNCFPSLPNMLTRRKALSDNGAYSQEARVIKEAENFRRIAVLAWSPDTIYPKNEYRPGSSAGQCGVTNFGFGIWLDWLGIVPSTHMFFEEGEIEDAGGASVGSDHTWLRAIVDDGYAHPQLSLRLDLAADQFEGIDSTRVVQWDDYWYPDPHSINGNRAYKPETVTRLPEYDVSRFNGRLGNFVRNICTIAYPDDARFTGSELLVRWDLSPSFTSADRFLRSNDI